MEYKKEEGTWRTTWRKTFDNGYYMFHSLPTAKKVALNLGLKVTVAAVCYGLGKLAGRTLDKVPYVNRFIPEAVNFATGIDVSENLEGLTGLLGAIYGFAASGFETSNDNPDRIEKVNLAGLEITLRK